MVMNIIVGRLAMNRFERKNQISITFVSHLHLVGTNTMAGPEMRSRMRCISWADLYLRTFSKNSPISLERHLYRKRSLRYT